MIFLARNKLNKKSRFLSLILRHKPDLVNITLDKKGYAPVKDILESLSLTALELDEIVETDEKGRYSYNDDKTKIRANQGHSIDVEMDFKEDIPPDVLFHGTATKSLDNIYKRGIMKMGRQYVHLSKDYDTAVKVGKRHGNPIVLKIDTKSMHNDGILFYISENGIWLTEHVPPKYISIAKAD